jgi:moderate conductance mechanosensitive channel
MPDFHKPPWSDWVPFLLGAGRIALVIVLAYVAIRASRLFVHGVVKALVDREATEGTAQELSAVELKKRMDTLDTLGSRVLQAFVMIIAAIIVLDVVDLNIAPAVAGLGVVGIAVGFGAQSLVRDYFTGALILIENQFSLGDVVTIAGVTGTVEDFSLRRTTLRDLDGVVHTVPNGEIHVASNRTRTWARINEDVTITYGTDVDKAIAVVDRVGEQMKADPVWKRRVLESPRVDRVEALGEFGVTLKILGSVRAIDQWSAGGEFRKRLLAAFADEAIEIASQQRVIVTASPTAVAAGQAAPTGAEVARTAEGSE